MIRYIVVITLLLLAAIYADGKTIVAVIDTGLNINKHTENIRLCEGLHADFTTKSVFMKKPPVDNLGHGTNVAAILDSTIKENSFSKDYCLAIIKFINTTNEQGVEFKSIAAKKYAQKIGAKVINYSAMGDTESEIETKTVKKLLDSGIKLFVAAGNQGKFLGKPGKICSISPSSFGYERSCKRYGSFPGMSDSRVVVVGNLNTDKTRHKSSNYGPRVNTWEIGVNINAGGYIKTGTSQATAVATGKYVSRRILNEKK